MVGPLNSTPNLEMEVADYKTNYILPCWLDAKIPGAGWEQSRGKFFGYVQPAGERINIQRLGAGPSDERIDGVLVVWLSRNPAGGVFITGWYDNATVYADWQKSPSPSSRRYMGGLFGYYAVAPQASCVLLPPDERVFQVPTGKNGLGQSLVWYADKPEHIPFKEQVLKYITDRRIPLAENQDAAGGYQPDLMQRRRVEEVAVEMTTQHYMQLGYAVQSVEGDNIGWDLTATLDRRTLRLEVKGLSAITGSVELTPNEYAAMRRYQDSYRICIVTNALESPNLKIFSHSLDTGQWEDNSGISLQINEMVGARLKMR